MEIGKFNLIKTEGRARRGEFCTAHGVVQTPVFQNVGTAGAIKGAVDAFDLKELGCQIELSNTYHLHVRPGDKVVKPFAHNQWSVGQRSFRLFHHFLISVFAKQRQFVEPVDNVFNICRCQYFDLGANSLQNNLSLA